MFYGLKTPPSINKNKQKNTGKKTVITQLKMPPHETSLFQTMEKRVTSISSFFSHTSYG